MKIIKELRDKTATLRLEGNFTYTQYREIE